ncbi:MAG: Crp/Fnr family transcriptional regulator [Hyphomicrobiaceae bacterium]|nr:Crp/Fnr family transcriptional regulator [Hyphomicrobiaceae bacterium]
MAEIPLFAGVDPLVVGEIANLFSVRDYAAGSEIVRHLEDDTDVYFVLAGRVKVRIYSCQGRIVAFRQIECGEIFGEYAALDGTPRSASVEAEIDTRVAVLSAADFNAIVAGHSSIAQALIQQLVKQIRDLTVRYSELSTLAVNGRIEAELLRIARHDGQTVQAEPNKILIKTPPTQYELANRVSTHREAISRHLSHLSRIGLIRRTRHALVIEDMQRLQEMVQRSGAD